MSLQKPLEQQTRSKLMRLQQCGESTDEDYPDTEGKVGLHHRPATDELSMQEEVEADGERRVGSGPIVGHIIETLGHVRVAVVAQKVVHATSIHFAAARYTHIPVVVAAFGQI